MKQTEEVVLWYYKNIMRPRDWIYYTFTGGKSGHIVVKGLFLEYYYALDLVFKIPIIENSELFD